jgi:hypothetical protein
VFLEEELNNNLTKKDLKKLRKFYIIPKKEILRMDLTNYTCSICFDSVQTLKSKIVKLPQCDHLFHWK